MAASDSSGNSSGFAKALAHSTRLAFERPDPATSIVYLQVPDRHVVSLQASFELYEGLGSVRTVVQGKEVHGRNCPRDQMRSIVAIISSPTQEEDCLLALKALEAELSPPYPPAATAEQWQTISRQHPLLAGKALTAAV